MEKSPKNARRILITNVRLDKRSGTEIVTKETAIGLADRGHTVAVYSSSSLGEIAKELIVAGVIVTNRIESLMDFDPDLIHANHTTPFLVARTAFPECPALWFCHDATAWHDNPIDLPGTALYVSYSPATRARLLSSPGITDARIATLLNATDVAPSAGAPPDAIRKVLIVAKYRAKYVKLVVAACKELGLAYEVVGGAVGRTVNDLGDRMRAVDMVVASGKVTMEAIALNRPVLCMDERGLAGLTTPDVSSSWAARNFGGTILRRRIEVDAMIAEIALYDADEFSRMRAAILPLVSMERYLDELEQLHDRTVKHQAKRCDVSLAKALESALPNYKPGGFYPFQAYELKNKAEARADAFATELSSLKMSSFHFGTGPDFTKLSFAKGQAGAALLEGDWDLNANSEERGAIRIPARAGWAKGRGCKIEGVLDLPEQSPAPTDKNTPFKLSFTARTAFSTYQRSTSERRRDICISGSTFQRVQTARLMP